METVTKRKLASIRKIKELSPIKGKDRIVLAIIDGWSVIVKKDEFTVGDLCVFFEIDSFLPMEDKYSFLKPTTYNGKSGYRLKTMKMSGCLSQGLALPLSIFDWEASDYSENDDVTEQLNIIKYDVSLLSASSGKPGNAAGNFPSFLPKTDQERIQNITHYFNTFKDMQFEETLKLDGSSMTCYSIPVKPTLWDRIRQLFGKPSKTYKFGVCSRNLDLKRSDTSTFWKVAITKNIESLLPCGYALQGELVGPKIQSNHEKVDDYQFYIFDIYDITQQRYLTPIERSDMMSGPLSTFNHVPVINPSVDILNQHTLPSLLAHVEGQSMNPGTISEGRVYKSTTNPTITFKVISNRYLLKCED